MPLEDIDVGLSDVEQAVRDTANKFAEEVLRPAGAELDRLADPADVIAKDSVLWKVFEKYRELGIRRRSTRRRRELGSRSEAARLRAT